MHLKVKKTLKYFELICHFDNEKYETSIYLNHEDMNSFASHYSWAATDGYYTVRKDPNQMIFFRETNHIGTFYADIDHLAGVLLDDRIKYEMKLDINPESFMRSQKNRVILDMNICQIINHKNISDHNRRMIIHIFHNAMRIGHYKSLKEKVLSKINVAHINPDGYGDNELGIYFDGRYPGGCGYNGGILFHGKHDGFGSGSAPTFAVTIEPTSGYSIHT